MPPPEVGDVAADAVVASVAVGDWGAITGIVVVTVSVPPSALTSSSDILTALGRTVSPEEFRVLPLVPPSGWEVDVLVPPCAEDCVWGS